MDYDKIFENDLDGKLFYENYPGNKMIVGRISLGNAVARLEKNEYYILVTYSKSDILPDVYIPLSKLTSDDGTLFATLNPNIVFDNICIDGGIQRISRLPDLSSGSPNYLLGPGPDTVSLETLVMNQYNEYLKSQTSEFKMGK